MSCYQKLREKKPLTERDCQYLESGEAQPFQLASLCVQLIHRSDLGPGEAGLVRHVLERHGIASGYLRGAFAGNPWIERLAPPRDVSGAVEEDLVRIVRATGADSALGAAAIQSIVDRFVRDDLPLEIMAIWLMTICQRGLSEEDMRLLTFAMRDSGRTYDYRGLPELGRARVIRRYPTGALSEKVALILPSMLAAVRDAYPIVSPFLVARSLAFTGGTWDKLKAIPGFTFPDPGEDSIRAMRACGVAMSVTHSDINPADRKMYAFRSTTGTVESHPLLMSSIASKQLALPADHLLMDVRHGDGAFCATFAEGDRLGRDLTCLISAAGVPCSYHLTDTVQPNGSAVGNALEVLEALAVMGHGRDDRRWDPRALEEQRQLVLEFFAILMGRTFADRDREAFRRLGADTLASGRVFECFLDVLSAHGVGAETRRHLREAPARVIGPRTEPVAIRSPNDGALRRIDQRQLGYIVNFRMGGGGNEYAGSFDPRPGVILHKRIGDRVAAGEVICSAYFGERSGDVAALEADLRECFVVS
jgi:thymidine phosphorylase